MGLDAIDHYLGPRTEKFENNEYELLRIRYVEQLEKRKTKTSSSNGSPYIFSNYVMKTILRLKKTSI